MVDSSVLPKTPAVDGLATQVHRLTYEELKRSPFLEPLYLLVNAAFATTHVPPYFAHGDLKRLNNSAELIEELGPTAVTYILTQSSLTLNGPADLRILASVTDEVHESSADAADDKNAFKAILHRPSPPHDETVAQRVVRFLVVDPSLMGQGIASWLLQYMETQILAEIQKEKQAGTKHWTGVRSLLSAIYEINGGYYDKRGWKTVASQSMPPGTLGGPAGFTIVCMEKMLVFG